MSVTWKSIAIIVAVVIVIAVITTFLVGNWTEIVNEALCTIQSNIGLKHHFHIPDSSSTWACHAVGTSLN